MTETPVETPATPPSPSEPAAPAPDANQPTDNANQAPATPEGDNGPASEPQGEENQSPEDLLFAENKEGDGESPEGENKEGAEGDGSEDGDSDEGDDGDESGEEAAESIDVAALEIPEEMPIPEALKDDVDALMKDMVDPNLTHQEKAQKMIDAHIKSQKHSLEIWEQTKQEWAKITKADETIGGDNFPAVQKTVNRMIHDITTDPNHGGSEDFKAEFQDDLKMLGLGNKRSFIKFMHIMSKRADMGEDSQGDSSSASSPKEMDMAERLYGAHRTQE